MRDGVSVSFLCMDGSALLLRVGGGGCAGGLGLWSDGARKTGACGSGAGFGLRRACAVRVGNAGSCLRPEPEAVPAWLDALRCRGPVGVTGGNRPYCSPRVGGGFGVRSLASRSRRRAASRRQCERRGGPAPAASADAGPCGRGGRSGSSGCRTGAGGWSRSTDAVAVTVSGRGRPAAESTSASTGRGPAERGQTGSRCRRSGPVVVRPGP